MRNTPSRAAEGPADQLAGNAGNSRPRKPLSLALALLGLALLGAALLASERSASTEQVASGTLIAAPAEFDVGSLSWGDSAVARFRITNETDGVVELGRPDYSCGVSDVRCRESRIEAGQTAVVDVTVGMLGPGWNEFQVEFPTPLLEDRRASNPIRLRVIGHGRETARLFPARTDLGRIALARGETRRLEGKVHYYSGACAEPGGVVRIEGGASLLTRRCEVGAVAEIHPLQLALEISEAGLECWGFHRVPYRAWREGCPDSAAEGEIVCDVVPAEFGRDWPPARLTLIPSIEREVRFSIPGVRLDTVSFSCGPRPQFLLANIEDRTGPPQALISLALDVDPPAEMSSWELEFTSSVGPIRVLLICGAAH